MYFDPVSLVSFRSVMVCPDAGPDHFPLIWVDASFGFETVHIVNSDHGSSLYWTVTPLLLYTPGLQALPFYVSIFGNDPHVPMADLMMQSMLILEIKKSMCQKWDSNPRLHSETRSPSSVEGFEPWVWRLRPLGHPDTVDYVLLYLLKSCSCSVGSDGRTSAFGRRFTVTETFWGGAPVHCSLWGQEEEQRAACRWKVLLCWTNRCTVENSVQTWGEW